MPTARAVGRLGDGDFTESNAGHVTRGGDLVYTGAQIIKLDQLDRMTEKVFSLNALWDLLIPDAGVSAVEYPGHWCDVGRPEGITLAENMMAHADV